MSLKNVKNSIRAENIIDAHCEKQVDIVTLFCIPWMVKFFNEKKFKNNTQYKIRL